MIEEKAPEQEKTASLTPMQVLAMYAPNGAIVQTMRLPPETDASALLHGELRLIEVDGVVLANPNGWRVDTSGETPVVIAKNEVTARAEPWHTVNTFTGEKLEVDRDGISADVTKLVGLEMTRRSRLPVEVDGVKFDADARAQKNIQDKITEIAAMQKLGQEIESALLVWRDYDNVTHSFGSMTELDTALSKVVAAIAHRGTTLYIWSWQVKQRCAELATAREIASFLDSQGVPTQ